MMYYLISGLGEACPPDLKYFVDRQQSAKYMSTSIKTSLPEQTTTFSVDRQVGAYFVALTIPGKPGCPKEEGEGVGLVDVSVKQRRLCKCRFNVEENSTKMETHWANLIKLFSSYNVKLERWSLSHIFNLV
jgi:hypothetical protein